MAEMTQTAEEKTEEQQDTQNQVEQEESKTQAQSAELSEAVEGETTGSGTSIDFLLDMNVPVTVTIGKIDIPIQRLLQLGPGSVLKLDKSIDTPADLYLRDIRFATGNIVVVEDRFAIKIKEIIDTDTPASLKK